MPASTPHLYKNRHGTYYLRIVASLKQQASGVPRDKWLSLKTKDSRQAKIFALTFALQKAQDQMALPDRDFFNNLKITAKDGESLDFDLSKPEEVEYSKKWKIEKDRELASYSLEKVSAAEIQDRLEQFRVPASKPAGKRLAQVMQEYFKLKGATLAPRTAQKYRSNVERFLSWAGDKITIDELTPTKWHEFKVYLATNNPAEGHTALNPKTIDTYTASMSNVLKMTQGRNHVLTGQLLVKKSQRERESGAGRAFAPDELTRIFTPERMNIQRNPANFWGVLIALLTGARLNEIFQLRIADVRTFKGVLVFDIQKQTLGNSLKTSASPRLIPIHDILIELGFMEYVEDVLSLPNASHLSLLFPFLNKYEQGYGDVPSQNFTETLQDLGLHVFRVKTFHSMRHTVNQKLKESGVGMEYRKMYLGHKNDDINMMYGGDTPVDVLKNKVMSAIGFDEIKWSEIKPNRKLLKHTLTRGTAMRVKADAKKIVKLN